MKIPGEVKKMLMEQGIIYLATSTEGGVPNVSPRTAYWVLDDDETIAICEWYRHKTFWNLQQNNHIAIAVVNVSSFTGWQMKGQSEIITDPNTILNLLQKVMTRSPTPSSTERCRSMPAIILRSFRSSMCGRYSRWRPRRHPAWSLVSAGGGVGKKPRPEVISR